MKLLLDECVDRRFAKELQGHVVKTVPEMGWTAKKNGELLALAEREFDVFITVDRNLSFQAKSAKVQPGRVGAVCPLKPVGGPDPTCSAGIVHHSDTVKGSGRNGDIIKKRNMTN